MLCQMRIQSAFFRKHLYGSGWDDGKELDKDEEVGIEALEGGNKLGKDIGTDVFDRVVFNEDTIGGFII